MDAIKILKYPEPMLYDGGPVRLIYKCQLLDVVGEIYNMGSHPCSYIIVRPNHPLYEEEYQRLDHHLVHGGWTYSGRIGNESWRIGWDYAHYGDFFEAGADSLKRPNDKKYTTPELIVDLHKALYGVGKSE